jgi:hypothetical protein
MYVGLIIGNIVSIPLHELGHLICGKLTGYKFLSFRVFNLLWAKRADGKIKFTFSPKITNVVGQCLMKPCDDERDYKFLLFDLGGGLVNIVTGAVPFILSFFLLSNSALSYFVYGVGFGALFLGITNLIPSALKMPNDGRNIQETRESADAKHGSYLMLQVNAEMAEGKLITDYPPETFYINENADTGNYNVAYVLLLGASRYEELGEYARMREVLSRIDIARLPMIYKIQVYMPLLFEDLVILDNYESVERAKSFLNFIENDPSEGKAWKKTFSMKHATFMPYYAAKVAMIDGNFDEAKKILEEAKKMMPTLQNPGNEHSLMIVIERLEKKIAEKCI